MPFVIGFLDWVRHGIGRGAARTEKVADEWDGRHRFQYGCLRCRSKGFEVGLASSCVVAECVERAEDVGPRWKTHGDLYILRENRNRNREGFKLEFSTYKYRFLWLSFLVFGVYLAFTAARTS